MVFANLKISALAVCHKLRQEHLDPLDEFVFHFNRCRTRYALFCLLLGIAVISNITYNMLIQPGA